MSPVVRSSRTTNRAKWISWKRAKGNSGFSESTTPGRQFIEASRARSSASRSGLIGAFTNTLDCGIISGDRCASVTISRLVVKLCDGCAKLETEMDKRLAAPIDAPKVEVRTD